MAGRRFTPGIRPITSGKHPLNSGSKPAGNWPCGWGWMWWKLTRIKPSAENPTAAPSFQRLLRDAEKGYFDCVLAWKSNRMGRNMLQAMTNEARLKDWGVRTFYAEEDFDDTAAGRFALRNMMNVNQFYSENMAEDITRGMMDNASKCLSNGALPLGYKAGENGRIVLDKAQAAVVQEIYTRVACREPFVDIAADLNRGIK